MSDLVIEATGLRKEFRGRRGTRVAVHDLDLAVPAGGVHGFLGPNGSGKTTTIRMLLGLARATQRRDAAVRPGGAARTCPTSSTASARSSSRRSSPRTSPGGATCCCSRAASAPPTPRSTPRSRPSGSPAATGDRYKSYSLGMKQRLAIAATLLKDPQLLILDEPTNGLDPAGIREIRETIRDLGERGVTVLLSSHILAEVQQVCTSATIIGNGRLLASGRVDDLIDVGAAAYAVEVPDADRAARGARRRRARRPPPTDDGLRVETDDPARITRTLGEAGIWLTSLTPAAPRPRVGVPRAHRRRHARADEQDGAAMIAPAARRADPRCAGAAPSCSCSPRRVAACPSSSRVIVLIDQQPLARRRLRAGRGAGARPTPTTRPTSRRIERCVDDPEPYGVPRGRPDRQAACESYILPHRRAVPRLRRPRPRRGARATPGSAVAVVVGLIALLLGTTFVGHDWNTGSMSNQLLFETRRLRVWAAKALAVALTTGRRRGRSGSTPFWLVLAARFWTSGARRPRRRRPARQPAAGLARRRRRGARRRSAASR